MKILKINEFNQQKDIEEPLKSFKTHKELNAVVWDENQTMKEEIRERLLEIANDVYDSLELDVEYSDIILTGSLSNYNHSSYSDFDLHILLDFTKVDENVELVEKYFKEFKTNWNSKHDIRLHGFDVEIYLQDEKAPHTSTGFYSILNDDWIVKPNPFKVEIDEDTVKKKSEELMSQIDDVEENEDTMDIEEINEKLKKIWGKIKKNRAEGLEIGEMGTGNIVFKMLRRNGYIEKVVDMKMRAYDKKFSIK